MSSFLLKKWYLDIADNKGNVYIGYALSLKWQALKLYGFQHLWNTEEGLKNKIGFTKVSSPKFLNGKTTWNIKGVRAQWESGDRSIEEVLLKNKNGSIIWKCFQPKSRAQIQSSELSFDGLGYTECIEATIPIWKLPFKTLYWGRCHSKNHYLVWIKWEGASSKNLIWHNGKRTVDFTITDKQISGKDFCLKFGKNYPVREGKIISIFNSSIKITKIIPKEVLLAEEHKWYNQGILEVGSIKESAITIYEKVLW